MAAAQSNLAQLLQIASLLKVPFLDEVSSSENQPLPPKVLCSEYYLMYGCLAYLTLWRKKKLTME